VSGLPLSARHYASAKGRLAMAKRIFIAILWLSSSLWSRNSVGVADGSDWKQYSQTYKVGWIDGFVTAMDDAQGDTAVLCAFRLKLRLDSPEQKTCTDEAQGFNFEMIKFGQYLDGMDAFYKDFRNTDYPINWAMKIVRDQIRGRSAEDIEKELAAWRQCYADSSKCLTPASSTKQPPPAAKQQ
jgi:hypothetical protein